MASHLTRILDNVNKLEAAHQGTTCNLHTERPEPTFLLQGKPLVTCSYPHVMELLKKGKWCKRSHNLLLFVH